MLVLAVREAAMPAPASLNMVFIVGRSAIHPRRDEPAAVGTSRFCQTEMKSESRPSLFDNGKRSGLCRNMAPSAGISEKTARQDLVGLVQAGLRRRLGARRGTRYVPVPTT